MKKLIILILLCMASICFGTDRYVSLTGDDSNGLTILTAYNTWDKAYEDAIDGADTIKVIEGAYLASNEVATYLFLDKAKDVTFQGWKANDSGAADAGEVTFTGTDSNARTVRVFDTMGIKTVTFKNLSIIGSDISPCINQEQDSTDEAKRPSVVLVDCVLTAQTDKINILLLDAEITTVNPVSTFSATNTTFNCSGGGINITAKEFESLTLDGCVFNSASTCVNIGDVATLGDCRNIIITGNTFNSTSALTTAWAFDGGNVTNPRVDETIVQFQFTGNQIGTSSSNAYSSNGIRMPQFADLVFVDNNNIYLEKAADPLSGILLGADADTNTDPLGQVICTNNTIEYTGAEAGHALLLGAGVNYAECSNNFILGRTTDASLAIGITCKGEGNNIANNIIKTRRAMFLKGGARNKITNNTCLAMAGGHALEWIISTDSPDKNYIVNNIFDGSAGLYALLISDAEGGNNYLDYNCWVAGSSALARDQENGNNFADLAALQSQWLNQTGWSDLHIYTFNDANSSETANVGYVNESGNDYRLSPNSPCLNNGRPTPGGGSSTPGGWSPYALPEQEYRPRYKASPLFR